MIDDELDSAAGGSRGEGATGNVWLESSGVRAAPSRMSLAMLLYYALVTANGAGEQTA